MSDIIDDKDKLTGVVHDLEDGFAFNVIPTPPKNTYEGRTRGPSTERRGVLTTQLQGHSYQVKAYYSQYLGPDDTTDDFKPTSSISVDQYIKIKDVVLKLSSPMPNYSINNETGMVSYSGTATTPCHFIPNKGDLFVATVDTGHDYMFEVKSKPERTTVFEQAAYTFEFTSLYDVREVPERLEQLESKVVLKKVYVPELTTYSEKSILLENEYSAYKSLATHRYYLAKTYKTSFMNHDVHTLLLPGQSYLTYDPDAVKAFIAIASMHIYGDVLDIERLNCMDERVKDYKTIWDLLREAHGDPSRLLVKKFGCISVKTFNARAWFRSVRYSGVNYIYSPRGNKTNQKLYGNNLTYEGAGLTSSSETIDGMEIGVTINDNGTKLPYVISVTEDDYYVFSEKFYKSKEASSYLEYLVLLMLKKEKIQPESLVELCNDAINWGELEYYYYVPVLLYLIEWAFKYGF